MNKTVFLTGGSGSFGTGFIELLLSDPDIGMVRVYSRCEHKQRELRKRFGDSKVSYYIGDVRDYERLRRAMAGAHWAVHAAALKQAPLGETEPQEFIKTNVQGSVNVAEAAMECGLEKALLISTDKAVEPVNLYGATKMCAERVFLRMDTMRNVSKTRFAITRYGNVAGTNGSVIPAMLAVPNGAMLEVHDPESTRFWITIREANQFVLDSLKSMTGGETFIPAMKSVRIMDIVEALRPDGAFYRVTGPRPGDKRHEVIEIRPDGTKHTSNSESNEFLTVEDIRAYIDEYRGTLATR